MLQTEIDMLGTVLRYDRIAAYGFIVPDDNTLPDYFACAKFIISENKHRRFLLPGWRVEFESNDNNGHPQALNIRVICKTGAIQRGAAPGVQS